MTKQHFLTKEGLENLKKELEYLKTTRRQEVAKSLKHAISFGDLSENAAYDEAKESLEFLENRIHELEDLIKNATIIGQNQTDKVQIGNTVEIQAEKSGAAIESYTLVGSTEANPFEGKISSDSLLGRTLLNLKVGNTFVLETDEGKVKHKILKIK